MNKQIVIEETAGLARKGEYLRVAIPCGRGELLADSPLRLKDEQGCERPLQRRVLKEWPDGSVKWLLVDFAATLRAYSKVCYHLEAGATTAGSGSAIVISAGSDLWLVDTGPGTFVIDAHTFRPFAAVSVGGRELLQSDKTSCLFRVAADEVPLVIEQLRVEEAGPLHAILRVSGRLAPAGEKDLCFSARLHFYAGTMVVGVDFTLHNPHPARHKGGLWDLGDTGSVLFRELSFRFELAPGIASEATLVARPGDAALTVSGKESLHLYQESSGGENWRSETHRNRAGDVPLNHRGYLGWAGETSFTGRRATPVIRLGSQGEGVAAAFPLFWQEFPKAIDAGAGILKLSLFPECDQDQHELQGGEQKTHSFMMEFAAGDDSPGWAIAPLQATASPECYRASGICHDLPGDEDLADEFCSAETILKKREVADEFGWRNFGDLYADHEAVYHEGPGTFVSHYNNQYDFIAGAYRKFFATGDLRWRELAADLARHVLDIDIYHTGGDRDEYNRGLFWHTDHYLDAGLATHRSYSCRQLQGRVAESCGGGPGAEHCYTTGLMIHYFQSGDTAFREAVIDLADWVYAALRGSPTVLGTLKRTAMHVRQWRNCRSSGKLFPRYPLTRGTGNAINATLDAFELGGGRHFLERAEELIRGALHPSDDVDARRLLEAERAWSYTVLLVAVVKFLDKKCELRELDSGFQYARSSLIAYATWMLHNEYPYLEKPEILEYPNETWAAQDLRKAVIFYHAARYANAAMREAFRGRARFFYSQAREQLLRWKTSSLSRPLTLMLQNGWVGAALCEAIEGADASATAAVTYGAPTPSLTLGAVAARSCGDLFEAARRTSIARELAWVNARLSR